MAYKTIDGIKYEKDLLDLATKHTTGKGEGKLSKDEVADLFKSANDGQGITDTERGTLEYIRNNYEFTDAAAKDFDVEFAKIALAETTEEKAASAKKASSKAATKKTDNTMMDIAEDQYDATTAKVISALTTLNTQIDMARETGSDKAKAIVSGFGGENKLAELIEDLAGYMGEAAGAGMTLGATPMVIMAGTAKGIYKKITD